MENELSGAVDVLPDFVWTVFLLPSLGSSCWSLWPAHAPTVPLTSLSEFPPPPLLPLARPVTDRSRRRGVARPSVVSETGAVSGAFSRAGAGCCHSISRHT